MGQLNVPVANNFNIGTVPFQASTTLSGDVVVEAVSSVPAAQPSTLTTRTDNNTGTLTMANSGHGIITGARLDLYWSGGCRRGMTVGTVAGVSVPIDLGSGDNLPIATTAINAAVPVKRAFSLTNANIQIVAVNSNYECQFTFLESDNSTEDWTQHLSPTGGANGLGWWYSAFGASPLTGTAIANVFMSHADTAGAHVMNAAALVSQ